MKDVTRILKKIDEGETAASDELLPLVYQELRKLAAIKLSNERKSPSIQPTVLVHDAFLRLVDNEQQMHWNSRGHFFSAAAEAMRRILIERARRRQTQKHGGKHEQISLDSLADNANPETVDLLSLDDALTDLEQLWPEKCRLVKLRYFAGLTVTEAAQAMKISNSTAERYWRFARAWLYSRMEG